MKGQPALVTPSVIKWAREKSFYSIDTASKKIGIDASELKKWEKGAGCPTLAKARKMAEVYRRPLASFYLTEPPKDFSLLKDFRTVAGRSPQYSTALVFLMRQIQESQAWLSQYLKEQGCEPLSFVGTGSVEFSEKIMSKKIIKTIWKDEKKYLEQLSGIRDSTHLLNKWIFQCEEKGIFISRTSNLNSHNVIPIKEARGFVIADKYAPFIFINSKDSDNAQLFTLLHELVHLWINISGIPEHFSNIHKKKQLSIEFFCNQTAAEILMPEEKINTLPKMKISSQREVKNFIQNNHKCFKVSKLAFLIRLKYFKMVPDKIFKLLQQEFEKEYREYEQKRKNQMSKSGGHPPPNLLKLSANGKNFTKIVFYSYKEGLLSGRDASNLLDMKLGRMNKIMKIAEGR